MIGNTFLPPHISSNAKFWWIISTVSRWRDNAFLNARQTWVIGLHSLDPSGPWIQAGEEPHLIGCGGGTTRDKVIINDVDGALFEYWWRRRPPHDAWTTKMEYLNLDRRRLKFPPGIFSDEQSCASRIRGFGDIDGAVEWIEYVSIFMRRMEHINHYSIRFFFLIERFFSPNSWVIFTSNSWSDEFSEILLLVLRVSIVRDFFTSWLIARTLRTSNCNFAAHFRFEGTAAVKNVQKNIIFEFTFHYRIFAASAFERTNTSIDPLTILLKYTRNGEIHSSINPGFNSRSRWLIFSTIKTIFVLKGWFANSSKVRAPMIIYIRSSMVFFPTKRAVVK